MFGWVNIEFLSQCFLSSWRQPKQNFKSKMLFLALKNLVNRLNFKMEFSIGTSTRINGFWFFQIFNVPSSNPNSMIFLWKKWLLYYPLVQGLVLDHHSDHSTKPEPIKKFWRTKQIVEKTKGTIPLTAQFQASTMERSIWTT